MNKVKYTRELSKDIYKRYYNRFESLLEKKGDQKSISTAFKLLEAIEYPKLILDAPMRRLTDQIFTEDKYGIYRENYKLYLQTNKLNWTKFEVKRLISDDQYELALMLALDGFSKDCDNGCSSENVQLLLRQYHLIHLVQMASERGDSIMLDQLINILQKHNVLSHSNYVNLLSNAIIRGDFNTVELILNDFKLLNFSDNSLYQIGLMYIANEKSDKVFELMMIMKDSEWKFKLSLDLIGSLEIHDGFKLLDHMVNSSPMYGDLKFNDLPIQFHQIKETNEFENLDDLLSMYNELKSEKVKDMLLQCLFVSIGNFYTGFNSDVFMINFLLKNKIPINGRLQDILCHNISHVNLKLTTISMLDNIFKLDQLTEKNWVHLLAPLFNGNEPDLIYVFLIKLIETKGDIIQSVRDKLYGFVKMTNDRNIKYLMDEGSNLDKFKEMINLNFIMRNMENEGERMRHQYELIPGYHPYNYEIDIRVKSKLQV